jgi:GNAT superfamily N-acetyltransferase
MLVKLYDMPETAEVPEALVNQGISIRRALPQNKMAVVEYVNTTFGSGWAGEADVCFSNKPVSCFIALHGDKLIGFACYDTTCLDYFGPTGVSREYRGMGIGKALLLKSLIAMREIGYAYAIIGGVKDAIPFYERAANAMTIPGSFPGIYARAIGIERITRS